MLTRFHVLQGLGQEPQSKGQGPAGGLEPAGPALEEARVGHSEAGCIGWVGQVGWKKFPMISRKI